MARKHVSRYSRWTGEDSGSQGLRAGAVEVAAVLNQWLQAAQRSSGGFTRFGVTDVTELGAPSDAVKDHLYELLQVSAVDPGS